MTRLVHVKQEIYAHEYLWRSSTFLLEKAKAEKETFHLLLPSLLMGFLAFEAFVNFCGVVLRPELWKEEKKNFKWKGIEGKLEAIAEKAPTFSWQKGQGPYQKIKRLEAFRDIVAHAKVVANQYDAEQKEGGRHFQYNHPWDEYLSVSAVEEARVDIKSFCESLRVEMCKVSDHPHLLYDAFEGVLAHANGSSID